MSKEAVLTTPLTQLDIDSRAGYIRDTFNIPQDQVNLLQQKYPNLFSKDYITTKQNQLLQSGITEPSKLIRIVPEILGYSTSRFKSELNRLFQIGFKSPLTAVDSYPQLIQTPNYKIQDFAEKVKNFGLDGLKMLNNYPAIITIHPEEIQNQINFLERQQFSNPHHIIEVCPRICHLKKENIIAIINKFYEASFNRKLFETSPGWFDRGILRVNSLKREFPHLSNKIFIDIVSKDPNLGQIKDGKEAIAHFTKLIEAYTPKKPITPELPQTRQNKPSLPKTNIADKPISVVPASIVPETPQARPPIESLDTTKPFTTNQKKLLIEQLNQQYSLNLSPTKVLINSRAEKISLIAQILSFYPNNPGACHKKTHFLAVTPIEDILIAFTKKQPNHTILNFCNEIRISNKQKSLSPSNKHQLITDFFNQHPEFKHLQTLYQKMIPKYLSPQPAETKPPETTPNSRKLTFINHILDFYPKTNPEYLSQAIETLSSLDPSSIFTAFILRRPQDDLTELIKKAKHHQNQFSDWERQSIVQLYLDQHSQTKKIVQSFLSLTPSS